MPKILIVYASLTGNTEEMARLLAWELEKQGAEVETEEVTQVYAEEFQAADICIAATYTYGTDGNIPDEMEDFYEDLKDLNLKGKVYGVLGSGQTFYKHFCRAVDYLNRQFAHTGAVQGAEPLKIELNIADKERPLLTRFAKDLLQAYQKISS